MYYIEFFTHFLLFKIKNSKDEKMITQNIKQSTNKFALPILTHSKSLALWARRFVSINI